MSYLFVYLVGVIVALSVMRDPLPARVVTALVWPLGPMAFLVVVPILLVTAAILWPIPVLGTAAAVAAVIYLIGC